MRRDIEITDQDMAVIATGLQRLAPLHFIQELQLVFELWIERGIGNIAACRNVEIMYDQRLAKLRPFPESDRDVTRIDLVAEGSDVGSLERQLRHYSDAVIALLPVQRHMLIAKPPETLQRKGVIDAFGLLQAKHIRPHGFEEFRDQINAQPH